MYTLRFYIDNSPDILQFLTVPWNIIRITSTGFSECIKMVENSAGDAGINRSRSDSLLSNRYFHPFSDHFPSLHSLSSNHRPNCVHQVKSCVSIEELFSDI